MPKNSCPNLINPYDPDGKNWETQHSIHGRVAPTDYQFLRERFTMVTGLTDKIVATLFKTFLDELRRIHATTPIEPAFHPGHASYDVLVSTLARCNFRLEPSLVGRSPGRSAGGHDLGTADGIHKTQQPSTSKRTKPKGGDPVGKRSTKKTKNSEEK